LELETLIPTQAIQFGIPRQGMTRWNINVRRHPSLALFK
jgi:hypothetical protein